MTLDQFARRIRTIGQGLVVQVDGSVAETAGLILTGVVTSTPVDTGRARGNWVVSINTPYVTPVENLDKTGRTTITRGKQVARQYRGGREQSSIYICNNVPYIGRLNEGYSAQAPAQFVQIQVQNAVEYLRNRKVVPR